MTVAIVKYNAGNIYSVVHALHRLHVTPLVTADPAALRAADKVIFPGVGEAATTMAHLRATGLADLLPTLQQPLLGICLGMQLLCRHSDEGDTDCLGIFDTDVKRFTPQLHANKVPHVGWNTITDTRSPLFHGFTREEFVYFVHSYYVPLSADTAAVTNYILPYSAALQRDNFYATQFHPEKSGTVGEQILKNFLAL